ncbi:TonB-dependent receptor [Psychrobium sp. MM17-31]|uniref:TonB-dependent receptor n=1 Tax=Psychrobium sp. MM17-31 TaxID=2917758 RepID=UPI001EF41892|nr:TonB-dependent receptor [Psychrobium sp. MM17-31]MCG7532313.1 TonB-dependent receptor [Psychrobium sp. MM17-31]
MLNRVTKSLYITAFLSLGIAPLATPAFATAPLKVSLPAGQLNDVLDQLSRQAKITLSYAQQDVEGISVSAINGNFSADIVLFTLLQNTDLMPIKVTDNAWLIKKKSLAGGNGDGTTLNTITVESQRAKLKDKTYRESASVNVITQETIERFRGTSVGDIFQGTPGVIISENRNSGGLDVNIRGMQGQGRVPVLIDGSRQETTVYRGYAGVSSRSYIDPDLIGNLQIVKGPAMVAQGTGATGGMVSVNTLGIEDIVKQGELSGFRMRVSGVGNTSSTPAAGTYAGYYIPNGSTRIDKESARIVSSAVYFSDCRFASRCPERTKMPEHFAPEEGMDRPGLFNFNSYAASLAGGKRFDWGDIVVAYAKREQGNYYSGTKGTTPELTIGEPQVFPWKTDTPVKLEYISRFRGAERIPNTNFSSESLLLKGSYFLPQDQSVELSHIRYDSAYGEMMPSQILRFGQARQWLDSEVLNKTYTARYRWQPVEYDWADLRANLWHTDATTVLNTPGVGSVDLEDNTKRQDNYQRWGIDITNSMRFFQWGDMTLNYGISGQWEDMDTDTPEAEGFYAGSRKGWRREFSAFSALKWQFMPQWTLDAGIRYSKFESKDSNPLPLETSDPACVSDGNDGCLPVNYKNDHSGSAPLVAITWQPTDKIMMYLRHAQALRMPSLFESTSGWSVSPALDIPINPEHAKNNEIGISYVDKSLFNNQHQLRAKLAYFDNHVDDYITRTRRNAWEERQQGFDFFRLRNIESLDLEGIELDVSYDATKWLIEFKGTKYNLIEVCHNGTEVRFACTDWGIEHSYINNMIPPQWQATLHLGGRLLNQKLEFGTRATFIGKRNSVPRYNANTGFNPPVLWESYRLLDLYAKYKFSDDITIDFTVDNVTDRYYIDALSLGLVPAPGRTARLGLNLQF